ncbi:MAG: hypothetical protein GX550_05990 [Syntrophomonadaceae bacterium]|nr:hypothetical protein [Syntrophomonadaceae bacterium]
MSFVIRVSLIALLIIMVITGLNISNQALNQLTLSDKGPVIGVGWDDNRPVLYLLGDKYRLSLDRIK